MAPRRPMSAFLKFSKTNRALVRSENPNVTNTDVSRILGERWRNMSEEDKRHYRETELVEREEYKQRMARFKAQQARIDASSRTHHSSMTLQHPEETDQRHETTSHNYSVEQERLEYEDARNRYSGMTTPLFRSSNHSSSFVPRSLQSVPTQGSSYAYHADNSRSLSRTNSMSRRHMTARIGSFAEGKLILYSLVT